MASPSRPPTAMPIPLTLLLLLLLLPITSAADDFLSPFLSPIMGDVCKSVECGKGKCKAVENMTLGVPYRCDCDPGWNHTLDSTHLPLHFLPCVIPNCSLYHSCAPPPSPPPQNPPDHQHDSIFNVCHWTYCGGGSCNSTSIFTHTCLCEASYSNLLNISAFPCFRDCEIGVDCANLGILLANSNTSPTPPSGNVNSQGGKYIVENSWWLLATFVALLSNGQL